MRLYLSASTRLQVCRLAASSPGDGVDESVTALVRLDAALRQAADSTWAPAEFVLDLTRQVRFSGHNEHSFFSVLALVIDRVCVRFFFFVFLLERQVYYHAGLIALHRGRAGLEEERQALDAAAALFAVGCERSPLTVALPLVCRSSNGTKSTLSGTLIGLSQAGAKASASERRLVDAWNGWAAQRRSQCGHCLAAWQAAHGRRWADDVVDRLDSAASRGRLFDAVLATSAAVSLHPRSSAPQLFSVDVEDLQNGATNSHHYIMVM